jgi:chromosome segregation ATPase
VSSPLKETNREALEALETTEQNNSLLETSVKDLKAQINSQELDYERINSAQTSKIEELKEQVGTLHTERDQLIKSGEASRTETARAQLQLDQAVKAVASAEKRENELNKRIENLSAENTQAEKKAAVAAARVEELKEKYINVENRLKEQKTEIVSLETALKNTQQEKNTAEKTAAVAEQLATDQAAQIKALEKVASENKELQQALTASRQEVTNKSLLEKDIEKRAEMAEQQSITLTEKVNDLKRSLSDALKRIKEIDKKKG